MKLKNLKLLMAEGGYQVKQLADLAQLSPSTVCKVSNGGGCNTRTANKLAKALSVSVADLIGKE